MYIVYQTTNLTNMKRYIGVHDTNCYRDKHRYYFGSGKALLAAIKKHGTHNFIRETLFKFKKKEDAYAKEAEIVNEILVRDTSCYNLKPGGYGGGNGGAAKGNKLTKEQRERIGQAGKGRKFTVEHKEKLRIASTGRKHSEEVKMIISEFNSKPISMLTRGGEEINSYPSALQAERITGVDHSSIAKCCRGKAETAGGYCWQYRPKIDKLLKRGA